MLVRLKMIPNDVASTLEFEGIHQNQAEPLNLLRRGS